MEILLLRTALAPCLVLLVSLVARRVGPLWGGRLLGAPTTSGPFIAVLCLGSGTATAAHAAHGSIAGQLSVACFCFAYGRIAPRRRPLITLLLSLAVVAAAAGLEVVCGDEVWPAAALALVLVLINLPKPAPTAPPASVPEQPAPDSPSWRPIAGRMAVSGVIVFASVTVARVAGPFLGGLLSALPVLLSVMAPSLHRSSGAGAAVELLRGALTSVAGTLAFLLVLCAALIPLGAPAAFAPALAALAAADRLVRRATVRPAGRTVGRGLMAGTWPNTPDSPTLPAIAHSSPVKSRLVSRPVSRSDSCQCSPMPSPERRPAPRGASHSSARSGSSG